jgi:acetyl-CoA carboxylase biotin carboxyl carrier protein
MTIEADEIPVIVTLFEDSDWDDLELVSGDVRLVLSKRDGVVGAAPGEPATLKPGRTEPQRAVVSVPPPPPSIVEEDPPDGVVTVRSPTLGTFFVAPKPGAPPFVHPGDRVTADDTLGIVEVMKLMNPVKAPTAGEVVKVCAANNELVEYDRVLFWIRPEGS